MLIFNPYISMLNYFYAKNMLVQVYLVNFSKYLKIPSKYLSLGVNFSLTKQLRRHPKFPVNPRVFWDVIFVATKVKITSSTLLWNRHIVKNKTNSGSILLLECRQDTCQDENGHKVVFRKKVTSL